MPEDKLPQQHLAETVILLRTLRGLTLVEVAARSGLSDVYLRQIERGERDVSIGSLQKLATGLSCDPGELLCSDNRSAMNVLIGEAFGAATEEEKQAVVFVLRPGQGESSARKKALLTLLAQEIGPLAPPVSASRGPGSAQGETPEQEAASGQARAKKPRAKRTRKR